MPISYFFVFIISFLILIFGLLLSSSGSTGGLAALSGHDLELFKKTKDYGFIKIVKLLMFIFTIVLLLISLFIIA